MQDKTHKPPLRSAKSSRGVAGRVAGKTIGKGPAARFRGTATGEAARETAGPDLL